MTSHVVNPVAKAANRVRDAESLTDFRHAVAEFLRALGEVPDEPAGSLSSEGAQALQAIGQDVIDRIEERVADISKAGDAQELVSDVYEIRRLLEETTRWRQHYTLARHP